MNINIIMNRFCTSSEDDYDLAEWARGDGSKLIEYVSSCKRFFNEYQDWILRGNDPLDQKEMIAAITKFDKEVMGG